ncbi:MAG: metalloregulator ArsR/SmtB family transcription factor [bacterium]|nr:metalloregulator ArsR/SmtB family transcription factor [bacterium]
MHANTTTILKALADETRLDIVRRLVKSPGALLSCDLAKDCGSLGKLSQPAISHHLSKLVDADILHEQKIGTEKTYRLNVSLLSSIGINPAKL